MRARDSAWLMTAVLAVAIPSAPAIGRAQEESPSILVWSAGSGPRPAAQRLSECGLDRRTFHLADGARALRTFAEEATSGLAAALARRFSAGDFELRTTGELAAVTGLLDLDFLLLVEGGTPPRARLYSASRGTFVANLVVTPAAPDAIWSRLERAAGVRQRGGRCESPVCGPAWFWAGAGVILLAVVGAGVIAASQDDSGVLGSL